MSRSRGKAGLAAHSIRRFLRNVKKSLEWRTETTDDTDFTDEGFLIRVIRVIRGSFRLG
jgi:hypothetical protein